MQYILFIHNNAQAGADEWESFFQKARTSGMFSGGSEIDNRLILGARREPMVSESIGGVMHFETTDKNALLQLLEEHPLLVNGGTLELCEMPKR